MRQQGRLSEWNDARGFGFVRPNGGGDRCFVHIRAFPARDRRPVLGDVITYDVQRDAQGRLNAANVRFALQRDGHRAGTARKTDGGRDWMPRRVIALLFLAGVVAATTLGHCPAWIAALYIGLSVPTFLVYWLDKSAAQRGRQRTPEKALQLLALAGGWPGALLAQATLRHKNRKVSFQVAFWTAVVINIAALAWLASADIRLAG
ncbi:DUF1294 domain-containing protein [Stenotrophomonas sp. NPDC047960]|uniref:DUF1294 domain-containing protein n=1 Tax=Stenotrophomonas sp. NPDC047960 TaxID=3364531 RepID=UPI003722B0FD